MSAGQSGKSSSKRHPKPDSPDPLPLLDRHEIDKLAHRESMHLWFRTPYGCLMVMLVVAIVLWNVLPRTQIERKLNMKKANKHSFSINSNVDNNSYSQDQKSNVTMSDEHFTPKQIAKVQMVFMQVATANGWTFENSVAQVDIPGDEEESWKTKAEEAKAENTKRYTELQDEKKKAKALQMIIDAGKAQRESGLTYEESIELELDKITYDYERTGLRKVLKDMNALTLD